MKPVLRDVKGGLVAATAGIAFSVANGALIYSGAFAPLLARGIGAGLLTTAIVSIVLAMTSGFRPVVATANSTTAAPLGALMASLSPALVLLPPEKSVATVYMLVAVTTLATGVVLLTIGSGRVGNVVRFVPHPVVAGFMGVNGTLLILGAIRFGTGVPVLWQNVTQFARPEIMAELAATAVFAILTTMFTRRARTPIALPALLVATIVLVNVALVAAQMPADATWVRSLFLPVQPATSDLPIVFDLSSSIAWDLIWPHLPDIAGYALLVTLSTLLTSVGLETALNVDVNFNRELRAQGSAVVVSGLLGGFIGNTSVGLTLAGVASGARGRLTGVMAGMTAFAFMWFGRPLLPFVPRFVIAGFLLEIGFWIVWNWCVLTRRRMAPGEWALVLAIVAMTVWLGLVPAILVGISGGCILFAVDLSRVDIVRRVYGLDQRTSPLVRSGSDLAVLARDGAQVQFVELRGTLFFGSAYQILTHVRCLLASGVPRTVVLDLTGVIGGDAATTAILARMRRLLEERRVGFAVAGGRSQLLAALRASGALAPCDPAHETIDAALEDAETAVLARAGTNTAASSFADWLTHTLGEERLADLLMPFLRPSDRAVGHYLCRQGEPTTTLLFIESGRVAVTVGSGTRETTVRVFGSHTVAGEHGFILQLPRTANLRVDQPARVWSLERRDFDTLSAEQPALVIALLRDIIRLQSERLAYATRQNAALA